MPLLEAVPNVSEGRDAGRVREIAAALASVPGVRLLDVSSDPDHHRSVLTAAGEPAPLEEGLTKLCRAALERIDLRHHDGVHPRIGAIDVVPLVPLAGAAIENAVESAERLGRRVGEELGVPVFLYGEAARSADRRAPAALRRLGLAALSEAIDGGALTPDYGPRRVDPRVGVTLIGARGFLVAFNVQLATEDVRIARAVAKAIRERDGGLPGVQALGLALESRRRAQVSVNLLPTARASLFTVVERIRDEASRHGVEIESSELVGLVPEEVALDAAADALRLPRLSPAHLLERRLASS
ncbi:MAG TPA: glutamate formimidoyltransferase [Thermoanaerobaculia bacterium]|nr:glutamate formimidoyltransferase [Thermoanaerobaculia bacterium]